jgi:hypothetical protein
MLSTGKHFWKKRKTTRANDAPLTQMELVAVSKGVEAAIENGGVVGHSVGRFNSVFMPLQSLQQVGGSAIMSNGSDGQNIALLRDKEILATGLAEGKGEKKDLANAFNVSATVDAMLRKYVIDVDKGVPDASKEADRLLAEAMQGFGGSKCVATSLGPRRARPHSPTGSTGGTLRTVGSADMRDITAIGPTRDPTIPWDPR